jgi:glycosyltransferase involved in cell wall biosynthesis
MPEILQDAGVYFDPEDPEEIASALKQLIVSPDIRAEMANNSYAVAATYSWRRCADDTFEILADTIQRYRQQSTPCVAS